MSIISPALVAESLAAAERGNWEPIPGQPLLSVRLVERIPGFWRKMVRSSWHLAGGLIGGVAVGFLSGHALYGLAGFILIQAILLLSFTGLASIFDPPAHKAMGIMTMGPDFVRWDHDNQSQSVLLTVATPVSLWCEVKPSRSTYPAPTGDTNFLQVGTTGDRQRFVLESPQQVPVLRSLLKCWYELHIPVRETAWDMRTFLLNPTMSYEEIRAFKQQYHVTLY